MIQRVWEGCQHTGLFQEVAVATDDERIFDHVGSFGGEAIMTSADALNGTARCWEASKKLLQECDVIVNVQGDEPLIHEDHLTALTLMFEDEQVEIASLIRKSESEEEYRNPHRIKVVKGVGGRALYFSRNPVPYITENFESCFIHLGTYAYRRSTLDSIIRTPIGKLAKAESLEQLSWLEVGFNIHLAEVDGEHIGVDTPEDAERVREIVRNTAG